MKITKSFLNHELQNILMMIGFSLEDSEINEKQDVLNLVNLASLFVEYEQVLLGKKVDFLIQSIPINDVFEMLIMSSENKIKADKISIKKVKTDVCLNLDRDYFLKALKQVFVKILDCSISVELKFNQGNNSISFLHNAESVISFEEKPLDKLLENKSQNYQEIVFQINLKVLRDFGCELESNKNEVKILLP